MQLLRRPVGGSARQPVLRPTSCDGRAAHDTVSILAKLKRLGPLTINELAGQSVMDRTTLARNVKPLERDGLIRIEPAQSDRRAKELRLTKSGEKQLVVAFEAWSRAQAGFESTFGPRHAAELRRVLRDVVTTEFRP